MSPLSTPNPLRCIFLGCMTLISVCCLQSHAAEYDLLLKGGKIVDGSGNPWFYGDVALRDNKIVAVEREISGTADKTIDVSGLIVAPGFIDIHSHSDWVILEDGKAQSKIRQGVTTDIIGEGYSVAPSKGKRSPREVKVGKKSVKIVQLKDYFDVVEDKGVSINIASYVGLNSVWECVMGKSFEQPGTAEIAAMGELVAEAMEEGALGLSSQLMMPPGLLAKTDDVVTLCKVVHQYNGIYSIHIRDEGMGVFKSIKQAIEIGERSDTPVDIIHLKIADEKLWGRMNEVVKLFEEARERGVNVQANVYPYTRGNNNLSSIIPPWAHEGGQKKMLERLGNTDDRAKMKKDIVNGVEGWYNHYTAVGGDWSRMLVSADNKFKGMAMDKVMAERIKGREPKPDLLDELFDFLIEQNGSVGTVYAHHTEKDMNLALMQPWCSVGSDGSAYAIEGPLRRGNPHPRNFGTFPRFLGKYVREQGLLPLEEAVRKITSLNAAKVGLKHRGLLKENYFADITVFDADKIIDRSDYTDPFHYNEGIIYVIVNGELVLDHDKHTGARPGQALRRKLTKPAPKR